MTFEKCTALQHFMLVDAEKRCSQFREPFALDADRTDGCEKFEKWPSIGNGGVLCVIEVEPIQYLLLEALIVREVDRELTRRQHSSTHGHYQR
jgi:hypothetical protein